MYNLLQIGMDVILYEVVRSDAVVAKGTIISVNPKTTLGGVVLGKHYCEVVVNVVTKRDAILPRPYPGVEKMGDALKLPIAWPYNRVTNCPSHCFLFSHMWLVTRLLTSDICDR
jgi:hypothetical protein